jgi:hypothetical protein
MKFFTFIFTTVLFSLANTLDAQCTASTTAQLNACFTSTPSPGTITLTGNIALSGTLTIPNNTYILYLNGYDITGSTWTPSGTPIVNVSQNSTSAVTQVTKTGTNKFSAINTVGSLVSAFSIVLSAELTQFKANTEGSKTKLNWQTVSEQNTSHFDIERSQNGLTFDKIGEVAAYGKGSDYSFIDASPLSGINYYRLTTTDLDGKTDVSKTISVRANTKSDKVKVYPNPVGTEGYLNVESIGDIHSISISNILGQVVLTSNVSKINIAQLSKGLYNITVRTNDETLTEKFFKN